MVANSAFAFDNSDEVHLTEHF